MFRKRRSKSEITAAEERQLLELCRIVAENSKRPATLLKLGDPILESGHQGSFYGHINALPTNTAWPVVDEEPMLPLLQLHLTDLHERPEQLRDTEYLLIFCGIDALPDMPYELLEELFVLSQKRNSEEHIRAFHARNASRITTRYSPNPDQTSVIAIPRSSPISFVDSQDKHSILKPHRIEFEQVEDTVDTSDLEYALYLSNEEAAIATELTQSRQWSKEFTNELDRVFNKHDDSKLGGWASFIQHNIDFGGHADFVLQISSNKELGLMLGDMGTLYIGYNPKKKTWVTDWACY